MSYIVDNCWVLMSWISIILDGEMMVWDPVVERYLAFGTLKSAALGELSLGTLVTRQLICKRPFQ